MRHVFDQVKTIDQSSIYDEKLYRQMKLLLSIGPSALPADQLDRVRIATTLHFNQNISTFLLFIKLNYNSTIESSMTCLLFTMERQFVDTSSHSNVH